MSRCRPERAYGRPMLALIALLAAGGCDRLENSLGVDAAPAPAAGERTVQVIARPVELTSNDRVFEAIGTGRARLSIEIYPAVAGEVTEVAFEAGLKVERGDVLVRLDADDERLAVRLAEVQLEDARNLLARYEQAVTDGAVPESEVDAARADVMAAEVALDQAKLALRDRSVRAPFTGHVGIPAVDPGDRIDTSTVVTGLDDRSVLHVDFEIPEALASALVDASHAARSVRATTPAWPGREFEGTIGAAEARVDPDRRTLMVRASLVNADDALRPGMSFNTRWRIPGGTFPTVPEIALQWGPDGSFVWVVREGRAERVAANVVARRFGRVLLDGDLAADERVVVEGLQRLKSGVAVRDLSGERS